MAVAKERILAEIKRTAAANGGVALGIRRFEKATDIYESVWKGKYWRTWSDALIEAGFVPNVPQARFDDSTLILAMIALSRKLGRFPAEVDLRMERSNGNDIPSSKRFRVRLGTQGERTAAVRAFILDHPEFQDVLPLLPPETQDEASSPKPTASDGYVYLIVTHLRSGKHYKIGRTESVPRRHRQIALELPEKPDVVHAIETDDPVGIEGYWHKRFETKRTNGEWFALSPEDVRAFKRRRFM